MAELTRERPDVAGARAGPHRRRSLAWLGVVPFFAYAVAFLLFPSLSLVVGAFQSEEGGFTLRLVEKLIQPGTLKAYWGSIQLSVVTAALGGLFGLLLAYAVVTRGTPAWVRTVATTFSGVAANFAGVPLAMAFVSTIGFTGIVTRFLRDAFGIDLYEAGFSLYSFAGLVIVYLYFQIPLMLLVITPALDGLRREWREAASNLGATPTQYWRHVALPILMPSLLGAVVLLFGNAFGAYATAYALTSGQFRLVPVLIGQVKIGNVLSDPHYGDALALGMVVVLAFTMLAYGVLQRKAARWQR
ncbi:MAG TPA: ABC transporter permease subunit [Actinomycetota bacterium]|nr:ABC transporter permease subunit [Actinomycetota bacterium]